MSQRWRFWGLGKILKKPITYVCPGYRLSGVDELTPLAGGRCAARRSW
ncbi:MAG: hypothetical protein U0S12_05670 [Fimbriimonadales bacterium]